MQNAAGAEGLPDGRRIRRWVRAAAGGPARVTVRFVDAAESRALNGHFRGIARATNVLSFGYATRPVLEGDLAVCVAVAAREAGRQGKTLEAHLAHLIVHGMLHLAGYDHENEEDAVRMETKEREILARLGFPLP
ncbi:MAG: rRNA maturation RNase YbeY [Rhodocyclaceae bacterium]